MADTHDLPRLERVGRRGRVDPAVAIVVVVAALGVAIASWKPWAASSSSAQPVAPAPVSSTREPAVAPRTEAPALRTATPAPRSSARTPAVPVSGTVTVAGLIWDATGERDRHQAWGVSMAYLPLGRIDDALVLHHSGVPPSLRWSPATPDAPPGKPLGAQGAPVVGLALTWPADVRPTKVSLRFVGSSDGARWPSLARPVGRPVALTASLSLILRMAFPGAREYLDSTAWVPWELVPGTYFLPPDAHAGDIVDWLSAGWRPGRYEYDVTLADGRAVVVPFELDSGV